MKLLSHLIFLLVVAASLVLLFGPREPFDASPPEVAAPGPGALEQWLAEREASVPDLRPGAEKEVVWADPDAPAVTPVSVVYVHGFSATKEETRPVPDEVAAALGANLFLTRLTGHGRDGPAMAEASVGAWFGDLAEALAVGRAIGERVLVIATSTGGTLAALGALDPELSRDVAGIVFISPNFRVQAAGSSLLTLPFARDALPAVVGEEVSSRPVSAEHARWWTLSYPLDAVFPMAALVKAARAADYSGATIPALFVFSDADRVVDPEATRAVAARWGAPAELFVVTPGPEDDANAHVIAGRIRSPSATKPAAARIAAWARETLDGGG